MPTATQTAASPNAVPTAVSGSQYGAAAPVTGSNYGLGSGLTAPAPNFGDVNSSLPDLNIPATNDASATADNSGGLSSILSGLGSAISSPLGTLGLLGGEYALISGQASSAQKQNNALAGQISAIGQPDVAAGASELGAYSAGKLTAPFQAQLSAAQQANQNTATSQSQQVAQLLANSGGGQNVQSAQASESGQISAAQNLANTRAMSQAFLGELSSSLSLTQTGGAYVQAGIMQEIQSNTQLQQQLSSLMGQLANAYAKSISGTGGASGTGTGAGGTGSLFNQVSKLLNPSASGPNVTQLAQGATTDANAMGANAAANTAADPTGVDAQLASGANSPLTMATTDPYSVEIPPVGTDLGTDLGTDVASASTDAAGGAASDLASFSTGSAAAGATEGGLTAADLSTVPGAADLGISTIGGSTAATGGGAAAAEAGGASAGLAAAAPLLGAAGALGIGLMAYEGLGVTAPDTISSVGPGQSTIQLQSGDTALRQGNFAIGAGGSRSGGAGQGFIIPAATTTIGGKTAVAGQPFALPAGTITGADATGIPSKNGAPDFASVSYDPSATSMTQANAIQQQLQNLQTPFGVSSDQAQTAALQAQYNSLALSASYNSTGGQKAWGVPFSTWLQQTYDVRQNVQGETW